MSTSIPFHERITCSIREACEATGLGRTTIHAKIRAGELTTTKLGSRTLVRVDSLLALVGAGSIARTMPDRGGYHE